MTVVSEVLVEYLEASAGGVIPCEAYPAPTHQRLCGKPSVARLRIACRCGDEGVYFLCDYCFAAVVSGRAKCRTCGAPVTKWTET
jgi:hypothetical protein